MCASALTERIAQMFDSSFGERCPGEDDCQRFQISEEPKSDACGTCELNATKPVKIEALTTLDREEIETVVDDIADLAAQQRAGFPLGMGELTLLEFELLKRWHSTVQMYERAQRAEGNAMLGAFLKAMCR